MKSRIFFFCALLCAYTTSFSQDWRQPNNIDISYPYIRATKGLFLPRHNATPVIGKDSTARLYVDTAANVIMAYSKATGYIVVGGTTFSRLTFDTSVTLTGSTPIYRTIISALPLAKGFPSTTFSFTQSVNQFTGQPNEVMRWGYNAPGSQGYDAAKSSLYYQMESRYVNVEGDFGELHLLSRYPGQAGEGRRISSHVVSNTGTHFAEHYNNVDGYALRDSTNAPWYQINRYSVSHVAPGGVFGYITTLNPTDKIIYFDGVDTLSTLIYRRVALQAKWATLDTLSGNLAQYQRLRSHTTIESGAPAGSAATAWRLGNRISEGFAFEAGGVVDTGLTKAAAEARFAPIIYKSPQTIETSSLTLGASGDYVFSGTTANWALPVITAGNTGFVYNIKNRGSGLLTINVVGGTSTLRTNVATASFTIPPGAGYRISNDGSFYNIALPLSEPVIEPVLLNSWTNLDVTQYVRAAYFKDASGEVNIRGALTGGATATSVMFTLPVGYRPSVESRYTCEAGTGVSSVKVMPNGNVVVSQALTGDPTSFIFLGNIKFRVD